MLFRAILIIYVELAHKSIPDRATTCQLSSLSLSSFPACFKDPTLSPPSFSKSLANSYFYSCPCNSSFLNFLW